MNPVPVTKPTRIVHVRGFVLTLPPDGYRENRGTSDKRTCPAETEEGQGRDRNYLRKESGLKISVVAYVCDIRDTFYLGANVKEDNWVKVRCPACMTANDPGPDRENGTQGPYS